MIFGSYKSIKDVKKNDDYGAYKMAGPYGDGRRVNFQFSRHNPQDVDFDDDYSVYIRVRTIVYTYCVPILHFSEPTFFFKSATRRVYEVSVFLPSPFPADSVLLLPLILIPQNVVSSLLLPHSSSSSHFELIVFVLRYTYVQFFQFSRAFIKDDERRRRR